MRCSIAHCTYVPCPRTQQIKTMTVKVVEYNRAIHSTVGQVAPLPRTARFSKNEHLECIRNARSAWEQGINEELQAIATESKRPFLSVR